MTRTVKVAIVGSGLAGLTAAYLFNGHHHTGDVHFDVHLFEKVCVHRPSVLLFIDIEHA